MWKYCWSRMAITDSRALMIYADYCERLTSCWLISTGRNPCRCLPEADWQRCMVNFHRNVASHVPSTKVKQVAMMLKAIYAQEHPPEAKAMAVAVAEKLLEMRLSKAFKWSLNQSMIHLVT